jgi:hypothetical protein
MSIISELASGAAGGIFGGVATIIGEIRNAFGTDLTPDQKAAMQAKLADLEIATINAQMEMIRAEASSSDPWTSRARPMFMYVFYSILLLMGILAPTIGIFWPILSAQFYINVAAGFKAIPSDLYALFGAGYLGYTGFRSFEKVKGATK